jgi:dipeptidyl aminopeptidase/acylaminoacyl peptidase
MRNTFIAPSLKLAAPSKSKPTLHRIVRALFYTLAILYLAGTVIGGAGLGWIAVHPFSHPITPRETNNAEAWAQKNSVDFQDAHITAPDGTALHACYMRPPRANGDAVILLHGVSDNLLGMYGFGKWLVENHYAVLMTDARGHGNSGGVASYGIREADDIHRWVDWIEAHEPAHCVYGLGESMGAAQLLQALPREARFCAAVAESPFASFREVAYARMGQPFHLGPWVGRTVFRPTVDLGFLYLRLKYGLNMEDASPEQAVVGLKTPVLLIHGLDDTNIPPNHSDLIQAKNPTSVVVWKVPGAVHTGAHGAAPEEFDRRVLEWFAPHSSLPN